MVKVHIIDDDVCYAKALANALEIFSFSSVIYASPDVFDIGYLWEDDCLLVDVYFPRGNGLDLMELLRGRSVPVVFMSNAASVPVSVNAMKMGAGDFIEKSSGISVIVDALLMVLAKSSLKAPVIPVVDLSILTSQEKLVFVELQKGFSSKKIAGILGVGVRTIEAHRSNILRKLGVKNVVEMISRFRVF